jgi:hypothetical protein
LECLDTLSLSYNGNEDVPVTNVGIAWSTDKAVKFQNPSDLTCIFKIFHLNLILFCFKIDFNKTARPPNWQISPLELDPNNSDNNGYDNEDFIVWMRTAAMPTFRKLYRKLVPTSGGSFQNGLPQGNYILKITYG